MCKYRVCEGCLSDKDRCVSILFIDVRDVYIMLR